MSSTQMLDDVNVDNTYCENIRKPFMKGQKRKTLSDRIGFYLLLKVQGWKKNNLNAVRT